MNILYYSWNSFMEKDMITCLRGLGHKVDLTTYRCCNYEVDVLFEIELGKKLEEKQYDCVFSFNYFPTISNVCNKRRIKYLSWIFDSPHLNLYSNTIQYPCNWVFHFDHFASEWFLQQGIKQVYHLPLAVHTKRLDTITCMKEEKENYSCNVSFVGRLYDKKNLYDQIQYLPDYIKGYLEGIMASQKLIYGYNFLEEVLSDSMLEEIGKYVKLNITDSFFMTKRFVFAHLFLGQKVTSMERIELLNKISDYIPVDLYSDAAKEILPKVNHRGIIDSEQVAPKVFKNSKINLNISLKTIQTGIPLRVFEIMGAGGFVLTNYQAELYHFFEPNKDFVVYENADDLLQKIQYYLEHEEERQQIATYGYKKVKQFHSFETRVNQMFEIAFSS